MLPASRGRSPVTRLKSVVLPAPFGPMIRRRSPGSTCSDTPLIAGRPPIGGLPAINGVSLQVEPGERRLIIGPNGAGKTTLFNLVTGDLPRDAGSIQLFGREVSRYSTHRRVHLGLARTYQIITLFPKDSLEHNIVLSLMGLSKARWNL